LLAARERAGARRYLLPPLLRGGSVKLTPRRIARRLHFTPATDSGARSLRRSAQQSLHFNPANNRGPFTDDSAEAEAALRQEIGEFGATSLRVGQFRLKLVGTER